MAGVITIKFKVIKDGQSKLGMVNGKSPIYIPGPVQPQFGPGRMLYFEGFSVDEHGKQHYMDATVAYRQSCLRVIEYLKRYGYSEYQIYLLLSCAPIEGHIAGIVDVSTRFLCSLGRRKRDHLTNSIRVLRFQMLAQPSVCLLISLTSISCLKQKSRSWTWEAVQWPITSNCTSPPLDRFSTSAEIFYCNGALIDRFSCWRDSHLAS